MNAMVVSGWVALAAGLMSCAADVGTGTEDIAPISTSAHALEGRINQPLFSRRHIELMNTLIAEIQARVPDETQNHIIHSSFLEIHKLAALRRVARDTFADVLQAPGTQTRQLAKLESQIRAAAKTMASQLDSIQVTAPAEYAALGRDERKAVLLGGTYSDAIARVRELTPSSSRKEITAAATKVDAFLNDAMTTTERLLHIDVLVTHAPHRESESHRPAGLPVLRRGGWSQPVTELRKLIDDQSDITSQYRELIRNSAARGLLKNVRSAPRLRTDQAQGSHYARVLDLLEEKFWLNLAQTYDNASDAAGTVGLETPSSHH